MLLRVYGLQIDVPKEYSVMISRGSSFIEGIIEISDNAGNAIRLDWNDLNKFINKYRTPEEFFRSHLENVKQDKSIREYKVEHYTLDFDNAHPYDFHKLSYKVVGGFPKREVIGYIVCLGVYCLNTNRFIIVQYRSPDKGKDLGDKAVEIVRSFRCKCFE